MNPTADYDLFDALFEVAPQAAYTAANRLLVVEDTIARLQAEAATLRSTLAAELATTISRHLTINGFTISYRAAYERTSYDAAAVEAARLALPEDAPARRVLEAARKVSVSYDASRLDTLAERVPGDTDLADVLYNARRATPVAATVALKRN